MIRHWRPESRPYLPWTIWFATETPPPLLNPISRTQLLQVARISFIGAGESIVCLIWFGFCLKARPCCFGVNEISAQTVQSQITVRGRNKLNVELDSIGAYIKILSPGHLDHSCFLSVLLIEKR